jgi:hypothetical protein
VDRGLGLINQLPGQAMIRYQVYVLNGIQLRTGETIHCASDDEAIDRFIANHLHSGPAELWQKGRRVAQLSPSGELAIDRLAGCSRTPLV